MIIFFGTIKKKKKIQLIMDYFLVNFSIHQGLFFFQFIKDIGNNQNGILLIQNVQTVQINCNQETINTVTSITTAELLLKLKIIIINVQTAQTNDKQRNMNISFNKNSAALYWM